MGLGWGGDLLILNILEPDRDIEHHASTRYSLALRIQRQRALLELDSLTRMPQQHPGEQTTAW